MRRRLADLYWITKVAYVGGGFSSGVHNLMEPAVLEFNDFWPSL